MCCPCSLSGPTRAGFATDLDIDAGAAPLGAPLQDAPSFKSGGGLQRQGSLANAGVCASVCVCVCVCVWLCESRACFCYVRIFLQIALRISTTSATLSSPTGRACPFYMIEWNMKHKTPYTNLWILLRILLKITTSATRSSRACLPILYDVMKYETQNTLHKPLNFMKKFTKNHNKCNPLQQGVRALLYDVMKHENPLYDVMEHEAQDTLYKPLKSIKNITVNSTEIFT